MKARKPKADAASKRFEKVGAIQRQIKRERDRHNNRMAGIAAQRAALHGLAEPALRAAKLGKLLHDEIEERQRPRANIEELERRAREVWR